MSQLMVVGQLIEQNKEQLVDLRHYGSKFHGRATPESDIDVLIEMKGYPPLIESKSMKWFFS